MIHGRDVVVISSIDWHPLWQTHQEIATRLGRAGNRVVFLENTGVRSPRLGDAGRMAGRLARRLRATKGHGFSTVAPNVHVHAPLVLPPFGSRARRALNRRVLLPAVKRAVDRMGIRDPVVLTFLPTDTAVELWTLLQTPASMLVYYCAADFEHITPDAVAVRASERRMVAASDLVLVQSSDLAERLPAHPRMHVLPPGVNVEAFPPDAPSTRLANRPVVGYVGGVHRHVDLELLKGMAVARPDWSFVLVGPLQMTPNGLGRLPNVHLVGPRPHSELASYLAGFDVCVVPYLRNSHTDTVVPTKIGEYLAMGKPVVSTDLPGVRALASDPEVLTIADGAPSPFAEAVADALVLPPSDELRARRREVAARLDWGAAVERLGALIASAA